MKREEKAEDFSNTRRKLWKSSSRSFVVKKKTKQDHFEVCIFTTKIVLKFHLIQIRLFLLTFTPTNFRQRCSHTSHRCRSHTLTSAAHILLTSAAHPTNPLLSKQTLAYRNSSKNSHYHFSHSTIPYSTIPHSSLKLVGSNVEKKAF